MSCVKSGADREKIRRKGKCVKEAEGPSVIAQG